MEVSEKAILSPDNATLLIVSFAPFLDHHAFTFHSYCVTIILQVVVSQGLAFKEISSMPTITIAYRIPLS